MLRSLIVVFIGWDLLKAETALPGKPPHAAGLAALAAGLAALWNLSLPRLSRLTALVALTVLLVASAPVLEGRRLENRWRHFATAVDVHGIPRNFVPGWKFIDALPGRATITLTAGWSEAGQNYFVYPLMGSSLQHTVTYVPVNAQGPPGSPEYVNRTHPDFQAWALGLATRQVTHVFVQAPWPIEDEWMRARPERFTSVGEGAGFRIYEVRGDADADASVRRN